MHKRKRLDAMGCDASTAAATVHETYIYMTVLGFAKLHSLVEDGEVTKLNNGENFTRNPGVQLLERACGMTMHGDREGSNALLRSAPGAMLEAYQAAKASGTMMQFFRKAFDRPCQADPCLEGRTSRLMQFAEQQRVSGGSMPPWEDISVQRLAADASVKDVAGEHLRVFCNECTWQWAKKSGQSYDKAKEVRFGKDDAMVADFARIYNADSFSHAMRARGVVRGGSSCRWEVMDHSGQPCLKPGMEEVWANYITKWIQSYQAHGVHIWAMTVQNEPLNNASWEACPALHTAVPDVQIFIYDHNKDQVANYAMDVLNNPVAGRYVAGVAYHWYSGDGWDQLDRLQVPAGSRAVHNCQRVAACQCS
eukprot:Skav202047  [mRNA]  locus=scaffold1138:382123:397889:- [translate_table: standard]